MNTAPFPLHTYGAAARPPLVLLHPGSVLHNIWRPFLAQWSAQYDVVALDIPPQRQPSPPLATIAQHVLDQLRDQGVDRFTLIGSSLGGNIALNMAVLAPHRITRLVLDSAQIGGQPPMPVPIFLGGLGLALRVVPAPLIRRFLLGRFRHLGPDDRAAVEADLHTAGKLAFVQHAKMNLRHDVIGQLNDLPMPILIIAGGKDVLSIAGEHQKLAAALPHADLHIIDAAGHITFLAQPSAFLAAIEAFLSRTDP